MILHLPITQTKRRNTMTKKLPEESNAASNKWPHQALRQENSFRQLYLIADYDYGSYTEDEKDALFTQNSKTNFLTRYNFESGELSQMPYSEDSGIYPSLAHTVGNTVWLMMSDSEGDFILIPF